jgi:hypothetical protein
MNDIQYIKNIFRYFSFTVYYMKSSCIIAKKNKCMQDILLSQKQYQALLQRLEEINKDVSSIKSNSHPHVGYIDTHDLMEVLKVSKRTVQRWKASGKIPFKKLGHRFYFQIDIILALFKPHLDESDAVDHGQLSEPKPLEGMINIPCKKCPFFWIFNDLGVMVVLIIIDIIDFLPLFGMELL